MMNDKLSATKARIKKKQATTEFSVEASDMDDIIFAVIAALEAYKEDSKRLRLPN